MFIWEVQAPEIHWKQSAVLPEKTRRSVGSCWNDRNTQWLNSCSETTEWPSMFISLCFRNLLQFSAIKLNPLQSFIFLLLYFLSAFFFALFFLFSPLKARPDVPSAQQNCPVIRMWSDGSDVGNQEILSTDSLQFSLVKNGVMGHELEPVSPPQKQIW